MASSVQSNNNKRQKLSNDSGQQTTASSFSKMDDPSLILETVLNCDTLQLGFEPGPNESGQRSFGLASDELDDEDDDDDDDDDSDDDDDDDDDDDELNEDDDLDDDDSDEDDDDDDEELYTTRHSGSRGKKRASQSASKSKSTGTSKSRSQKKKLSPPFSRNAKNNTSNHNSKLSISMSNNSATNGHGNYQADVQKQLAAAGPAGVAAAAAIATAKKRKRPYSFETNPSIRKRQQTRLIRKLRACIDEYTMRVGQQAVVLITMPGKQMHNYKVFGAQPLESVIRDSKDFIMSHLEQALLEQAPEEIKDDPNKHELPPLVIDGIPTPVEKMTQAQLRAFIPMMLKYSTGRGKPGWGKDSTRPAWWPESLPWANVRSDARDEDEKQRISWTTTLRQIVTNCYMFHGRDDLLPSFDESEIDAATTTTKDSNHEDHQQQNQASYLASNSNNYTTSTNTNQQRPLGSRSSGRHRNNSNSNTQSNNTNSNATTTLTTNLCHVFQTPDGEIKLENNAQQQQHQSIYSTVSNFDPSNVMHTISNGDGTVSLIQVDPANTQILTLPDGTQVRAVRLQTLQQSNGESGAELNPNSGLNGDQESEQHEHQQQHQQLHTITLDETNQQDSGSASGQTLTISEASLNSEGQIIVTGEDGLQSCYSMSNLVSIPASMYQQFANAGGAQTLSLVNADGTSVAGHTISIQAIQEPQEQESQQQDGVALVIGDASAGPSDNDVQPEEQQLMIGITAGETNCSQQQDGGGSKPSSDGASSSNDKTNTSNQLLIQETTSGKPTPAIKQEEMDQQKDKQKWKLRE